MSAPSRPPPHVPRLLLTGAAGGLGRVLRPRLKTICDVLRVSDLADLGEAAPGEELHRVALEDREAMLALLEGVDAVVHLGGVSTEKSFAQILAGNIVGMVNLYDAARLHGTKRIVFASSNHVTGFYRQDEHLDTLAPLRPDGHYGLSKAYGENLARWAFDRFGIETACLRIGSSFPAPKDRRMLATWLSYGDLESLVRACLAAPPLGFTVVYAMSDNRGIWWDNRHAAHLGWQPKDSSEPFRAAVEQQPAPDPDDPATIYQGGAFVRTGPFE